MRSGNCLPSEQSPTILASTSISPPLSPSSGIGSSKGSVNFIEQVQVFVPPADGDDPDLPGWAVLRLDQVDNTTVIRSGLIISTLPHLENVIYPPNRRARRCWDVPTHGECFFARGTATVIESTLMAGNKKTPAKTQTRSSAPVSSRSQQPCVYSALARPHERNVNLSRTRQATRRKALTRHAVFATSSKGGSSKSSSVSKTANFRPANNEQVGTAAARTAKLIKPFSSCVNVYCYPSLQCRHESKQVRMYSCMVVRDSRSSKFKRPLPVRTPGQLLFGSVISNKTTTLRLAKFGVCQTPPVWKNPDVPIIPIGPGQHE